MGYFKINKKMVFISLLLFCIGVGMLQAQNIPKTHVVYRTVDEIQIDGKATELSWKKANWTSEFIDIEGEKKPMFRTRVKMLRDSKYLYFFAALEEPHVWGTLKQRDTVIFYNNDFEIFIDPDGDTHNYYELEMNALNTLWDLFLTKPYRNNGKVLDSWDIQGIKTAIAIKGTLNDASDKDSGWNIEIAIPWAVLTEASESNSPPENTFWRLNFSRVNWDFDLINGAYSRKKNIKTGDYMPEYNWVWSPQGVIAMHEPEKWGYIYFSEKEVGNSHNFQLPKDEYIKEYLYELYRSGRDSSKTDVQSKSIAGKSLGPSKVIFGKEITPVLEKHAYGQEIYVKSPFTEKILRIKDDGKFLSYDTQR